tara:strand:+ start:1098 stop:2042 length:945 start_codon:yes stop_codon:yes gene_type:complete
MTSKNEDKMYMGKNRDLNVYPINIDEDKLGEDDDRYPLPNKVHFNVFLGSIRSGKSTLLNSMYLSPRFMGGDMYDVRILISATALNDVQMKYMCEEFDYIFEDYSEALLEEILEMIENDTIDRSYLLVIDDAMSESGITQKKAGKSDKFTQLITRYRHVGSKVLGTEGRLAICVCLQFFKYLTPALRNQIQGLFLMGSFPEAELNKIAESYSFMGGSKKAFVELFNKSKEGEYDFTYINVPRLQMWRNFTELLYDKKNNFSVVPIEQFKNADTRRKEGTDVEEPSESEGGKGKKKRRGKKGTDTDKPVLSVIKA